MVVDFVLLFEDEDDFLLDFLRSPPTPLPLLETTLRRVLRESAGAVMICSASLLLSSVLTRCIFMLALLLPSEVVVLLLSSWLELLPSSGPA